MLNEFISGTGLAIRRWPTTVSMSGIIGMTCIVLALLIGDIAHQYSIFRGGQELRENRAVSFTPYYANEAASIFPDSTLQNIVEAAQDGKAYTAVINNLQIDDLDFADGHRVIAIAGDAARSIFPGLSLCSPAPCAMRGFDLRDAHIAEFSFAGNMLNPDQILHQNAVLFDANVSAVELDQAVLAVLPPSSLLSMDQVEREEAVSKTVLLDPLDADLDEFVEGASSAGLHLIPHRLDVDQPERFRQMILESSVYLMALVSFSALTASAFLASSASTIAREVASMQIRRTYGATRLKLAMRVTGFLSASLLAIPAPVLFVLATSGTSVSYGAMWVSAGLLAAFLLITAFSVRRVLFASTFEETYHARASMRIRAIKEVQKP